MIFGDDLVCLLNSFVNKHLFNMDDSTIDSTWPNCNKKSWPIDDDIVISGIGGRFPESDNLDELANNLIDHVDMVTRDERRWPIGVCYMFYSFHFAYLN